MKLVDLEEPKQETLEEYAERIAISFDNDNYKPITELIVTGAKWQTERICNSEIIQKIRNSKSDAEARRIIRTI